MNPETDGPTIPEARVSRTARTACPPDHRMMFRPDQPIRRSRRPGGSAEFLHAG